METIQSLTKRPVMEITKTDEDMSQVNDIIMNFHEKVNQEDDLPTKMEKVIECHPALVMTMQAQAQIVVYGNNSKARDLSHIAFQTIANIAENYPQEREMLNQGQRLSAEFLGNQSSATLVLHELKRLHNKTSGMKVVVSNLETLITLIKCFAIDNNKQDYRSPVNKDIEKFIDEYLNKCQENRDLGRKEQPVVAFTNELIKKCFYTTKRSGFWGLGSEPVIERHSHENLQGKKDENGNDAMNEIANTLCLVSANTIADNHVLSEGMRIMLRQICDQDENMGNTKELLDELLELAREEDFNKQLIHDLAQQASNSFKNDTLSGNQLKERAMQILSKHQARMQTTHMIIDDHNNKKQKTLPAGLFEGKTEGKLQLSYDPSLNDENAQPNKLV